MAKEKDEDQKGSKLKEENAELIKALELIKEKCADATISAGAATEEILKIIDETLNH